MQNGDELGLTQLGSTAWTAAIDLQPDTNVNIEIIWLQRFNNQDLELTTLTEDLTLRADGTIEQINSTGFSVDIDRDGDGISNLREREQGTDPFVPETPTS